MIADVLNVYGSEVAPTKKSARQIGYCITHLLEFWGDKTAAEISAKACREYVAPRAPAAAGADLKVLKAAVMHWHQEYGPLTFIPSFWRPSGNPPKERWLTKSEAARLLWAARRDQHIKRMILLGLHTGSRPGVLLALRWDQVDLRGKVLSRTPINEIEDKHKRAPKVMLGRKIMGHLRRWKRMDGPIEHVCHLEGRQVGDPHGSWRRIVKAAGLTGITRHTLRHTRATWMMRAGVSIWDAAGFLGMTIKTLEKVYAHHDPKHMDKAANI